ncbi:MAG: enoyl-CoA hydratase/isomerase family protein [Actinomycetota bacterium]
MEHDLVLRDDAEGIATLTLNRPDKLNAMNPAAFVELRTHLESIKDDESVRVVVLRGAGRSFCAGNDLGSIAAGERAPTPHYQAETIDLLEALPQATIAQVHGHCFTGALELILGCDLIVCAQDAQIGDTHGQWGLIPVWGMSVRLPERVGVARARELSFTAKRISGTEAAAFGLANHAVPLEELDGLVAEMAGQIAASSAGTVSKMKRLITDSQNMERTAALLRERERPYGRPDDMEERMRAGGR